MGFKGINKNNLFDDVMGFNHIHEVMRKKKREARFITSPKLCIATAGFPSLPPAPLFCVSSSSAFLLLLLPSMLLLLLLEFEREKRKGGFLYATVVVVVFNEKEKQFIGF